MTLPPGTPSKYEASPVALGSHALTFAGAALDVDAGGPPVLAAAGSQALIGGCRRWYSPSFSLLSGALGAPSAAAPPTCAETSSDVCWQLKNDRCPESVSPVDVISSAYEPPSAGCDAESKPDFIPFCARS